MGLHVTSLAQFARVQGVPDDIRYFVYFLNYYQFRDEVVEAFINELPALEDHFAEAGNALIVTSVRNRDFSSDVLSWHNICGLKPEEFGPAFLITTLPPSYFLEQNIKRSEEDTAPWVLLPLRHCKDAGDLRNLLKRLVLNVRENRPLADFETDRIYEFQDRPILTGKAKVGGVELDLNQIMRRAKKGMALRIRKGDR